MEVVVESPIKRTGRVQQVEGMFDVPPGDRQQTVIAVPAELEQVFQTKWEVGVIVGPSGSGKTLLARELFKRSLVEPDRYEWPQDSAIVDVIPGSIKEVTKLLGAVGFGSPPAWLRPYQNLSTGERFRATMARALAEANNGLAVDEFTSVVDRQVAKATSYAVQKAVRRQGIPFVAVTCHEDVVEWLEPDWVYRTDLEEFARGRLRRPELSLEIRRVGRDAWRAFRHHHYLSADLHVAASCFGGFIGDECVGFLAWYRFPHPKAKDIMVCHRIVVLPDYQGLGVAMAMLNWAGDYLHGHGDRWHITLAHPALIAALRASPRWDERTGNRPSRSVKPKRLAKTHASARKLATRTFQFRPLEA